MKYHFGGAFEIIEDRFGSVDLNGGNPTVKNAGYLKDVYIKSVVYNNPATIVFWSDNTKTISKCHGDDVYSKETGLAICVLKKIVGSTKVHDLFEDWVLDSTEDDKNNVVNISKIRKKNKFCKKCKEEVCRNSAIKIELK